MFLDFLQTFYTDLLEKLRWCPSMVRIDLSSYLDTNRQKQHWNQADLFVLMIPNRSLYTFVKKIFLPFPCDNCLYPNQLSDPYAKRIHGNLHPNNYPQKPIKKIREITRN